MGQTTAPVMSFWLLFLLSVVLASLLYCVFQLLGKTFRRALGIVALLAGMFAIGAIASRKAGESRTEFLVGRDIHQGKNVAILFSDEYGGLVTREVDLSSHTLLPTVFLIARAESVPVMQMMSLKR